VFDKHRRSMKGSARRSRTEAFLEWAAENPDEVLLVQQAEADKALHELLKQERELGRSVRSARRYKKSPAELAKLLADVPF
jgi:uroporphyrinogen-III synthase